MKFETGKKLVVLGAAVVLAVLSGCKSGPEILDDKGAMSVPTPSWVNAYLSGGNYAVEALPEYKDMYCFVIAQDSTDKPFLLAWVGNVDGPREVASLIATTVETNAQSKSAGEEGSGIQNTLAVNTETMSNASYTGVRKMADWWRFIRTRTTKDERFQAYVLYTGEKKSLNDQIVRNLQNIIDNNKAMSAAERAIYSDIMDDIRRNGLFN
jgi:hypothetical protein